MSSLSHFRVPRPIETKIKQTGRERERERNIYIYVVTRSRLSNVFSRGKEAAAAGALIKKEMLKVYLCLGYIIEIQTIPFNQRTPVRRSAICAAT